MNNNQQQNESGMPPSPLERAGVRPTSKVTYVGDLRTSSEHLASGSIILSDAPTDNHGKGEAFSPTDTVANAVGSCMLTVMAIKAKDLGVDFKNASAEVTKIMGTEPRRISEVHLDFKIDLHLTEKERIILERSAMSCPVFNSLHPDIIKKVNFVWG